VPRAGLACALAAAAASPLAAAECLVLASHPDGRPLAQVEATRSTFAIAYVHSVTRTPVDEHYLANGEAIVQTRLTFEQHGPGLPTEADPGGTWRREDGRYVVTMARRFPSIAMRVHADQKPTLSVDGDPRRVDLAQWGDRAISLASRAGPCLAGPTGRGAR